MTTAPIQTAAHTVIDPHTRPNGHSNGHDHPNSSGHPNGHHAPQPLPRAPQQSPPPEPPPPTTPRTLSAQEVLADPTLLDLFLDDYFEGLKIHEIARNNRIDLADAIAILESPEVVRLMDDLTRHAQLQAERLATLARPAAVTKLRYLVEADPCNSRMLPPAVEARSRETTRKAAACLERISKPPKPRPAQAPAPQADTRAAPQRPDPDTSPAPAPDPAANSETAHAPVPPSRARSEPPPGAPGEMAPSCTTESRLL